MFCPISAISLKGKLFRKRINWFLCLVKTRRAKKRWRQEIVSLYPVVVFRISSYSKKVKQLLTQLGASFEVLELDVMSDGGESNQLCQDGLDRAPFQAFFIEGKHIGRCDKVTETNKQGKLVPLLTEAGALTKTSSKL